MDNKPCDRCGEKATHQVWGFDGEYCSDCADEAALELVQEI